ncbi:MAG: 16S rRNA (uracil(1498)-N(3))-methyltransferase [Deltaproteobacteria bacterium]|nr:16S rRNA (uracil(1498)-N(3))-methyltransferase [Candidatus Anaeroferrophillus wilburensis]MBN2890027.1 16S rRNA (uracil(1498)-N(3))-methyltransferase [Deltaproteobacteria bacterium]
MANFSFTSRITASTACFDQQEYYHTVKVLRQKVGSTIRFLDGCGGVYRGTISCIDPGKQTFEATIEETRQSPPPRPAVTLAIALPKGKKFDIIVQKAVELGIQRIIPLVSRYSMVKPGNDREVARKHAQRQKTALEALKQCGNPFLPELCLPLALTSLPALADHRKIALVFDNHATTGISSCTTLLAAADEIIIIIGPEGGFAREEIIWLNSRGYRPVSLGSPILRLETAAIAAMAIIQYLNNYFQPVKNLQEIDLK